MHRQSGLIFEARRVEIPRAQAPVGVTLMVARRSACVQMDAQG